MKREVREGMDTLIKSRNVRKSKSTFGVVVEHDFLLVRNDETARENNRVRETKHKIPT